MYLIDTNIFLEILLTQEKQETCKNFLSLNVGRLHISDFSLHSIGVILFRNSQEAIFQKFVDDIIPNVEIISLSKDLYKELVEVNNKLGLDFDDTYQYQVAVEHGLELVTMDRDFEKVKNIVKVMFL